MGFIFAVEVRSFEESKLGRDTEGEAERQVVIIVHI